MSVPTIEVLYQALKQQPIVTAGSILTLKEGRELNFALQSTFLDSYGKKKRQAVQHISINPAILTPFSEENKPLITDNLSNPTESSIPKIQTIFPAALHLWTDPVVQSDSIKQTIYSPSGQYRLLFMMEEKEVAGKDAPTPKTVWLEVWQKHYRVAVISGKDSYDDVYQDGPIGSFAWNQDETKCLFIASPAKTTFASNGAATSTIPSQSDPSGVSTSDLFKSESSPVDLLKADIDIEKYKYESAYGETFSGKKAPNLFVLDLTLQDITRLDTKAIDPFEAVFYKSDSEAPESIYFIGFDTEKYPKRPGLTACPNRPTQLYRLDEDGLVTFIDLPFSSISQLRKAYNSRSTSGSKLYFLAGVSGGPHKTCSQLVEMDADVACHTVKTKIIVDLVKRPEKNEFPGLYTPIGSDLPARPFIFSKLKHDGGENSKNDPQWLITTSLWHSRTTILLIDLANGGQVTDLTPQPLNVSWSVLDVHEGYILANYQSFSAPPRTVFGKVDLQMTSSMKIQWFHVQNYNIDAEYQFKIPSTVKMNPYTDLLPWLANNVQVAFQWYEGDSGAFQSFLVFPKNLSPFKPVASEAVESMKESGLFSSLSTLPLVVIPHGGPHASALCVWHPTVAALVSQGICVLFPNYHGSLGYGSDFVSDLVGKIGSLDISDVHKSLQDTLVAHPFLNASQVSLLGGSHGGWIGAHMSMQHPKAFQQVILLNPVTDIILNSFVSDIMDWSYFESGRPYDFTHPSLHYSTEDLIELKRLNPAGHYQDGKAYPKTKLILGEKDLRVPLANGLRWLEFLKSKHIEVEAYILPNTGHALTGVEQELALFKLTMQFILNLK